MHVYENGSSSPFVRSKKRNISWIDLTHLSVRKISFLVSILYLIFFSRESIINNIKRSM
jgi:hypothetical protein